MRALILATLLTFAVPASAQQPPLPPEQLDAEARLTLAKAFVGEGGWEAHRDWDGIAWVLSRRWQTAQRSARGRARYPRFVDMVRQYCAPLRGQPKKRRQRWIRALTPKALQPPHWPAHRVDWSDRVGFWRDAMTRAWEWAEGLVADPCRGRAWHFGGPMDEPPRGHRRIWCGPMENTFYARTR